VVTHGSGVWPADRFVGKHNARAGEGRPLSDPQRGSSTLSAPDVTAVGVDAAFDAACKLVRRERTGSLFRQ
jgi:hypothetical protein